MGLFIILLVFICIIILFRKNILNIVKRLFTKKICIIFTAVATVIMILIGILIYIHNNPKEVDENICILVEDYISQNYGVECKVKSSEYTYNEFGFTGGLHMYFFKLKDENGKRYTANYMRYEDLDKDTVSDIVFKEYY